MGAMDVGEATVDGRVCVAQAEIVVVNRTGESIWCVQVAPNGAVEWGVRSADSGIPPEGEQHWNVPSGSYQLRAETTSGIALTYFGLRLREGQRAVWSLGTE